MLRLPEEESIFSSVSVSHTSPPQGLFLCVSCLSLYLCQSQGSWNLVNIVQHGRQPRSSWEFFCRHTSESQTIPLRVSPLSAHGPSGEIHHDFYIFTAFICFSSHSNPDSSNLDKVDLIKQENTFLEYIFQSYLYP